MTLRHSEAYCMATHIGSIEPRVKLYFDMPLHNGNLESVLSDINRWSDGTEIQGEDFLRHLSTHPALMRAGHLHAVQARLARRTNPEREVIELKGYFTPNGSSEMEIRAFVQGLRQALPTRGAAELSHMPGFAGSLTGRLPVFYVSAAYRPNLEIEIYHDAETSNFGVTPSEVLASVEGVFDEGAWREVMRKAVEICMSAGLKCTHASQDAYPYEGGSVSMFFDTPQGEDRRDVVRSAISQICAAYGIPEGPPAIFSQGSLSGDRIPFGVAFSARRDGAGGLGLALEEASPDVVDHI